MLITIIGIWEMLSWKQSHLVRLFWELFKIRPKNPKVSGNLGISSGYNLTNNRIKMKQFLRFFIFLTLFYISSAGVSFTLHLVFSVWLRFLSAYFNILFYKGFWTAIEKYCSNDSQYLPAKVESERWCSR